MFTTDSGTYLAIGAILIALLAFVLDVAKKFRALRAYTCELKALEMVDAAAKDPETSVAKLDELMKLADRRREHNARYDEFFDSLQQDGQ